MYYIKKMVLYLFLWVIKFLNIIKKKLILKGLKFLKKS
jgi:hypothetical protein